MLAMSVRSTSAGRALPGIDWSSGAVPWGGWMASGAAAAMMSIAVRMFSMPARNVRSLNMPWSMATSKQFPDVRRGG